MAKRKQTTTLPLGSAVGGLINEDKSGSYMYAAIQPPSYL